MVIGLKSAGATFTRVVKMDAHEDRILLLVLDCHTFIERDKDVRVSGHNCFYLRLAQLPVETLRHIKSDHLFRRAVAAVRTTILSAVSCIYDYSREGFTRILDASCAHAAASCQ